MSKLDMSLKYSVLKSLDYSVVLGLPLFRCVGFGRYSQRKPNLRASTSDFAVVLECISVRIYPSDYSDFVYKCQRVLPFPWAWSIGVPHLPVVITSSRDF